MTTRPFQLPTLRAGLALCLAGVMAAAPAAADEGEQQPERRVVKPARLAHPPVIDGQVHDDEWREATAVGGFIQLENEEGAPVTEPTEVFLGYDAQNLYVAFRCRDSEPDKIVSSTSLHDTDLSFDDHVQVMLDTANDRQNAFLFSTNPQGAKVEGLVRAEGNEIKWEWDAPWTVATARDEHGWTVEMAIPFQSLRYPAAEVHDWGFNLVRFIGRKKEVALWSPIKRSAGYFPRYKVSRFGTIAGMTGLSLSERLQLRPYVAGQLSRQERGPLKPGGEAGLGAKLFLNSSIVADMVVRPDFGTTEADLVELNTTRYRPYIPEKRDFFLEGANLFYFGYREETSAEVFEPLDGRFQFFFSRQIGLVDEGMHEVPIFGGAKVTGQAGPLTFGLLNLTTKRSAYLPRGATDQAIEPASNYSVARFKAGVYEGSTVGAILLNKEQRGGTYNRGGGIDWDLSLGEHLRTGGFVTKTSEPGAGADDVAANADLIWDAEPVRFQVQYADVGKDFDPKMGFISRTGMRKVEADGMYILRTGVLGLQRLNFVFQSDYVMDRQWKDQSIVNKAEVYGHWPNAAEAALKLYNTRDAVPAPFTIRPGITIPAGRYEFTNFFTGMASDYSKPFGESIWFEYGQYYGGTRLRNLFAAIWRPLQQLEFDAIYDRQQIRVPAGSFVSHKLSGVALWTVRRNLSARATAIWSNDDIFRMNYLLDWNFSGESHAYLLYDDRQDLLPGSTSATSRVLMLKVSHLFGF